MRERLGAVGDLAFWAARAAGRGLCIVALARPQALVSTVRKASADIVILQDASASMYVTDVQPDRWRRSVQFLRTFAETLSWQGDRVALALFAQLAAPQVRLTKDPNALFFFIDHLGEHSPFRLENATTWDTNIEEGHSLGPATRGEGRRGLREERQPESVPRHLRRSVVERHGGRRLQSARAMKIPVHVVGIGTIDGGMIPEPARPDGTRPPPVIRSVLDRASLVQLAVAGGGEYFEIGDEPDRIVAFRIVDRLRRRADVVKDVESFDELYGRFLMAAAVVLVDRDRIPSQADGARLAGRGRACRRVVARQPGLTRLVIR